MSTIKKLPPPRMVAHHPQLKTPPPPQEGHTPPPSECPSPKMKMVCHHRKTTPLQNFDTDIAPYLLASLASACQMGRAGMVVTYNYIPTCINSML